MESVRDLDTSTGMSNIRGILNSIKTSRDSTTGIIQVVQLFALGIIHIVVWDAAYGTIDNSNNVYHVDKRLMFAYEGSACSGLVQPNNQTSACIAFTGVRDNVTYPQDFQNSIYYIELKNEFQRHSDANITASFESRLVDIYPKSNPITSMQYTPHGAVAAKNPTNYIKWVYLAASGEEGAFVNIERCGNNTMEDRDYWTRNTHTLSSCSRSGLLPPLVSYPYEASTDEKSWTLQPFSVMHARIFLVVAIFLELVAILFGMMLYDDPDRQLSIPLIGMLILSHIIPLGVYVWRTQALNDLLVILVFECLFFYMTHEMLRIERKHGQNFRLVSTTQYSLVSTLRILSVSITVATYTKSVNSQALFLGMALNLAASHVIREFSEALYRQKSPGGDNYVVITRARISHKRDVQFYTDAFFNTPSRRPVQLNAPSGSTSTIVPTLEKYKMTHEGHIFYMMIYSSSSLLLSSAGFVSMAAIVKNDDWGLSVLVFEVLLNMCLISYTFLRGLSSANITYKFMGFSGEKLVGIGEILLAFVDTACWAIAVSQFFEFVGKSKP